MIDLSTDYLGLALRSPLVASAVRPLLHVDRDLRDGGILFFKLAHADSAT